VEHCVEELSDLADDELQALFGFTPNEAAAFKGLVARSNVGDVVRFEAKK
jgi:hypothetical protein